MRGFRHRSVAALRRLIYCGEWIESHTLHMYMLHAPDFLGYQDAIQMAKDHGDAVKKALKLKKIGNELVTLVGGREIHPINLKVGGFYSVPTKKELEGLVDRLKWARDAAVETVQLTATFPFPEFERDYEFVALRHGSEYPFNEGMLVSSKGLNIPISEYENNFVEEHVSYSNALHSVLRARGPYFVGPIARFNLNYDKLGPVAQEASAGCGIQPSCEQPLQEHRCTRYRTGVRL